jgi:hypothetical protein
MTPLEAPEGVELRFFPRPTGTAWATWRALNPTGTYWENRKIIRPRLLLIHTNGGPSEAHIEAIEGYAMSAQDNTKPTYQVDRDGRAAKFLPSDRQGIACYQADPFAVSIETADLGYGPGDPGEACGFTPEQAETIARIVAYESELWDFPIETPVAWNGEGVASHTDPFAYPYWTKYPGKVCPGAQKKLEVRELIMPRAREIRHNQTPPEDDDMTEKIQVPGDAAIFIRSGLTCTWAADTAVTASWEAEGLVQPAGQARQVDRAFLKALELSRSCTSRHRRTT